MKHLPTFIILFVLTFLPKFTIGQTVLWTEDFEGTPSWSLTNASGTNGTDANIWEINDSEGGVAPPGCGVATNGNQTLHVACQGAFCIGTGASYNAGDGGLGFVDATTNVRAEYTVAISTVGQTNLSLNFDWIGVGQTGDDFASVLYSIDGGGTWINLQDFSGGAVCGAQGQWANVVIPLPVACENQADLRFAFNWTNSNDGNGSDPSFAVNDMELTTPSAATPTVTSDFTMNTTSPICEGTTVTFTDASTASNTTISGWSWTFNGGDVTSANTQGPHAITFNTAGTYDVDLTVDDGTINDIKTISLTVNAAGNAGTDNSANLCNNTTLDLNTELSGADAGGTWVETSTTPSGQFSAGTGVLDGNGLTAGNVYTFTYTVNGTAPCPDDVSTLTVTIIDCSAGTPPTSSFTLSNSNICVGDCINITENSTPNDITAWDWDFGGGATNTSGQNPGSICFNTAGTYTITLTVTNPFGTDQSTEQITVNDLPNITATAAPSTTLCTGDQLTLTGGGGVSYTWDNGVTDGVAFTTTTQGSTVYTVTGLDGNGCSNTASTTVTVSDCQPLLAGFSFNDDLCLGDCINFTDTSSGSIVAWQWDFGSNATPQNATGQDPGTICFNAIGVQQIQLTITDAGGNSVSVTNNLTVHDIPTVQAELDTLIDLGGTVDLISNSPNFGTYLWTPDTYYIDCDTCAVTTAKPEFDVDYIVVFTDPNGCTAQDTVSVEVNFIEGIGVPDAFSPNGDGQNDLLVVKGYGIEKMTFKIYNRYGQLVFETNEQTNGWDGTFKGRDENPGVFTWVLEYRLLNNATGTQSGNTTLIR
ncbi:MAG: PKD domain-containing protein [Putridiphycobacter sp.]